MTTLTLSDVQVEAVVDGLFALLHGDDWVAADGREMVDKGQALHDAALEVLDAINAPPGVSPETLTVAAEAIGATHNLVVALGRIRGLCEGRAIATEIDRTAAGFVAEHDRLLDLAVDLAARRPCSGPDPADDELREQITHLRDSANEMLATNILTIDALLASIAPPEEVARPSAHHPGYL